MRYGLIFYLLPLVSSLLVSCNAKTGFVGCAHLVGTISCELLMGGSAPPDRTPPLGPVRHQSSAEKKYWWYTLDFYNSFY